MNKITRYIKKIFGMYNFKVEAEKWVANNLGEEYVEEFLDCYDKLNNGVPIGNIYETIAFLYMIERIKDEV